MSKIFSDYQLCSQGSEQFCNSLQQSQFIQELKKSHLSNEIINNPLLQSKNDFTLEIQKSFVNDKESKESNNCKFCQKWQIWGIQYEKLMLIVQKNLIEKQKQMSLVLISLKKQIQLKDSRIQNLQRILQKKERQSQNLIQQKQNLAIKMKNKLENLETDIRSIYKKPQPQSTVYSSQHRRTSQQSLPIFPKYIANINFNQVPRKQKQNSQELNQQLQFENSNLKQLKQLQFENTELKQLKQLQFENSNYLKQLKQLQFENSSLKSYNLKLLETINRKKKIVLY